MYLIDFRRYRIEQMCVRESVTMGQVVPVAFYYVRAYCEVTKEPVVCSGEQQMLRCVEHL